MTDRNLLERVRRQAGGAARAEQRAERIADLIRLHTGRRWVGIFSNDVANDPRYLTALDTTGSELIAPVFADGQVVGTLDVEDARTDAFDLGDQALFEGVAVALTDLYG